MRDNYVLCKCLRNTNLDNVGNFYFNLKIIYLKILIIRKIVFLIYICLFLKKQ